MKRKFISILLTLVLVLSFSLVTATPAAAADITVGGDFATIQAAIGAAVDGDTILVAEGTYSAATGEAFPIIVSKDITIKASGAVANTILDVNYAIGVRLEAAATLEGFTITNLTSAAIGIVIPDDSAGGKAIGNVIDGGWVQIGNNCSSITVQGNIINGGHISMAAGNSDILIKGNKISNYSSAGIEMKPKEGNPNSNVTVENNEVDSCSVAGIWHYQGFTSTLTIRGNKVSNSGPGIRVSNGSDITIENNEVYNNTSGISIGIGSDGTHVGVGAEVVVNYNNIYGNPAYGLKNWDDTETVDATNNYWGDATGPAHANNPHATPLGDAVIGNVSCTPWYATATTTPRTEYVSVDHDFSSVIALSDTIQGGIDAALAGDTINVAAGIYDEAVPIGKQLMLLGAQHGVDPTAAGARTDEAAESIIKGTSIGHLVNISAVGVTVDGFTITGATGHEGNGIQITASDATIENNIITGNNADGISTKWADNTLIQNNVIKDNAKNVTDFMIDCWRANGIEVAYGSGNTVKNNVVSGQYNGIYLCGGRGPSLGNTLTDNIIEDNSEFGILLAGGDNIDNIITGNDIKNSKIGIYQRNGSPLGWGWKDGSGPNTGNEAHHNNIVGNTEYGVYNFDIDEAETFDALYNWWGYVTGPDHATLNTGAQGDAVSDNVLFSPWLYEPQENFVSGAPCYAGSVVLGNEAAEVIVGDVTSYAGGWNSLSTPITLAGSADTWGDLLALVAQENGLSIVRAQRFDLASQKWVTLVMFDVVEEDYQITPGEGFFIQVSTKGSLPILCHTDATWPPMTNLVAGQNLIGLSNLASMTVANALYGISYSVVLSPLPPNAEAWSVPPDEASEMLLLLGEAYWVAMGEPGILFGHTTTPVADDMTWELNQ